ncbi:unnamed protein product, partial [Effrenium voratum]
ECAGRAGRACDLRCEVLRHEENEEARPITCNGNFSTAWSKTMAGVLQLGRPSIQLFCARPIQSWSPEKMLGFTLHRVRRDGFSTLYAIHPRAKAKQLLSQGLGRGLASFAA